jgi:peptide deformylase
VSDVTTSIHTRSILTYGHPVLRQAARPVQRIDGALQQLIDDMVETMYAAPGVGLAANQVGSLQRVFVANPSEPHDSDKILVLINPELVEAEGEIVAEEGCLSIPDFREEVRRARRVLVRGLDRNERPIEVEAQELLARILQHELDHLNGILFVDRLSPAKRDILLRKLKKTFLER